MLDAHSPWWAHLAQNAALVLLSGSLPFETQVASVRVLAYLEGGNRAGTGWNDAGRARESGRAGGTGRARRASYSSGAG